MLLCAGKRLVTFSSADVRRAYDIVGSTKKKATCVLKIPVWFCNETDAHREEEAERWREGKGRRNVKLLHLTQDGFSLSLNVFHP